jgi:diketogulonate reductase-like aldo/keto reductase
MNPSTTPDKRIDSAVTLNNGVSMPYLGLGVFQAKSGGETRDAVRYALELGYRHIDTASVYRNEQDVGQGIRDSSIARSEIFVTTKVWNSDQGYESTLRACRDSLQRLGLDYVDLYLIHWPVEDLRPHTWRALQTLAGDGLCRAIGVSNYMVRHLQEVCEGPVIPAVDQVELSPFLSQRDLIAFCRQHGIQVEAYSPLARARKFGHEVLRALAAKHDKTEAQIMIRWALEHDLVVIPKSSNPRRIRENAEVFDFSLDKDDMQRLDGLNENFRVAWDPTHAP